LIPIELSSSEKTQTEKTQTQQTHKGIKRKREDIPSPKKEINTSSQKKTKIPKPNLIENSNNSSSGSESEGKKSPPNNNNNANNNNNGQKMEEGSSDSEFEKLLMESLHE